MATAALTTTDQDIRDQLASWQERIVLGGNHRYTLDGKYTEGVTTVLKTLAAPALIPWAGREQLMFDIRFAHEFFEAHGSVPFDVWDRVAREAATPLACERLRDKAADIGTEVHSLIEHTSKRMIGLESQVPIASDAAHATFTGFEAWAKDVDFRPIAVEQRVTSAKYGYCGTLDCLAWVEGRLTVTDWKSGTGSGIYVEHRLQSAAYRKALEEMIGVEADGYILKLPKDGGEITRHPLDFDLDNAFLAFLSLLDASRRIKSLNRRSK